MDRFNPSTPSTIRSTRYATVRNSVFVVGFASIPTQIIDAVVRRISIVVAALHSFGAWADKRCCYQSMNVFACWLAPTTEIDKEIPGNRVGRGRKNPLSHTKHVRFPSSVPADLASKRLDAAHVADFVKTLISDDRFPCFHDLMVTERGAACQA